MGTRLVAIACVLLAGTAAVVLAAAPERTGSHAAGFSPETVTVAPAAFEHVRPGEYLHASGRPTRAPRIHVTARNPVEIMRYQVTLGEYARCVDAGACKPADGRGPMDAPVTGVSHIDAAAYAAWMSKATDETWRLPTDEEWAQAAAEKFVPDVEPAEEDPDNPARAWLSSYSREAALGRKADPVAKPKGTFGTNSNGVSDLAGNVWEWTSTCYVRVTLADDEGSVSEVENCGVHVVEGFHRTYMSNFIRDGKSGGCAVGLPPDNLGFRLVREQPGFLGRLKASLGRS